MKPTKSRCIKSTYQCIKAAMEFVPIKTSITASSADLQRRTKSLPSFSGEITRVHTVSYVSKSIVSTHGKHLSTLFFLLLVLQKFYQDKKKKKHMVKDD